MANHTDGLERSIDKPKNFQEWKWKIPYSQMMAFYLKLGPKRSIKKLYAWMKKSGGRQPSYNCVVKWSQRYNWEQIAWEYDLTYHPESTKGREPPQPSTSNPPPAGTTTPQGRPALPDQASLLAANYPGMAKEWKPTKNFQMKQSMLDVAEGNMYAIRRFLAWNAILTWADMERALNCAIKCHEVASAMEETGQGKAEEEAAKPVEEAIEDVSQKYDSYFTKADSADEQKH